LFLFPFSFFLFPFSFFLFPFLAQRERVLVGGNCSLTAMQISGSKWQDLLLVVWSSCNRDDSLATIRACRVVRRLQTTIRPETTFSGNSFSVNNFFLFSFHRENAFRLVGIVRWPLCRSAEASGKTCPCGMVQLQPGCQSCNDLRLSCWASIANDDSTSNNILW
jgi:hypothetical protein